MTTPLSISGSTSRRVCRAELAKDMDYVRDVLAEGNKKANAIANETLEQVRDAMGMRY